MLGEKDEEKKMLKRKRRLVADTVDKRKRKIMFERKRKENNV